MLYTCLVLIKPVAAWLFSYVAFFKFFFFCKGTPISYMCLWC